MYTGVCDFRVNITVGAPEERSMFSGLHIVADIFCCCCGGIIGWKYVISLSLSRARTMLDPYKKPFKMPLFSLFLSAGDV